MLKGVRSVLLQMRAAGCEGKGRFDKVVELLSEADRLTPNEPLILLSLGDAYRRLRRFDEALQTLQGVDRQERSFSFNLAMTNVLVESGAPIEDAIPYIRAALRNRMGGDLLPVWAQRFKYLKLTEDSYDDWIAWAEKILFNYESGRS